MSKQVSGKINLICFSMVYIASTIFGGGYLIGSIFLLLSIPNIETLYGLGIVSIFCVLTIFIIPNFIQKFQSVKKFFLTTFLIQLLGSYIMYWHVYAVHHHIFNPAFYAVVGGYALVISLLITYSWKRLVYRQTISNTNTLRIYGSSFLLFLILFYTVSIDKSFVPVGEFLMNHFTVNIFFFDWAGYFIHGAILYMNISIAVISFVFSKFYLKKYEKIIKDP